MFVNKLPLRYYILPQFFFVPARRFGARLLFWSRKTYRQSGWFDWLVAYWLFGCGWLAGWGWLVCFDGLVYVLHCLLVLA
jgi:hypothetical protein